MLGEMALLVLYAAAWSKKERPEQGYKSRPLGSGCSFLILSLLSVLPSFFPPCHINCCTYTSRYGLLAEKIRLGGIFQPESFLWAVARKMKTSWNINYWVGGWGPRNLLISPDSEMSGVTVSPEMLFSVSKMCFINPQFLGLAGSLEWPCNTVLYSRLLSYIGIMTLQQ